MRHQGKRHGACRHRSGLRTGDRHIYGVGSGTPGIEHSIRRRGEAQDADRIGVDGVYPGCQGLTCRHGVNVVSVPAVGTVGSGSRVGKGFRNAAGVSGVSRSGKRRLSRAR